jgi:hypothetical protein
MPGWYLVVSGAVALVVLAGVAYRALTDSRRREAYAGGADFDATYTDAPTFREAAATEDDRVKSRERPVERIR